MFVRRNLTAEVMCLSNMPRYSLYTEAALPQPPLYRCSRFL